MKSGKFDPTPSETPEPIVTKICMGDYVGDPYSCAKFHHDKIISLCPPQICEDAHQVTRLFFCDIGVKGSKYRVTGDPPFIGREGVT